jgi:hypothetical protein
MVAFAASTNITAAKAMQANTQERDLYKIVELICLNLPKDLEWTET